MQQQGWPSPSSQPRSHCANMFRLAARCYRFISATTRGSRLVSPEQQPKHAARIRGPRKTAWRIAYGQKAMCVRVCVCVCWVWSWALMWRAGISRSRKRTGRREGFLCFPFFFFFPRSTCDGRKAERCYPGKNFLAQWPRIFGRCAMHHHRGSLMYRRVLQGMMAPPSMLVCQVANLSETE